MTIYGALILLGYAACFVGAFNLAWRDCMRDASATMRHDSLAGFMCLLAAVAGPLVVAGWLLGRTSIFIGNKFSEWFR